MNSKLWVVLVALALGSLLLPSLVSAQEEGGLPVTVVFVSPSPILPDIIGPVLVVFGVIEVQITGPEVEFTGEGTPIFTSPNPVTPPSPIVDQ